MPLSSTLTENEPKLCSSKWPFAHCSQASFSTLHTRQVDIKHETQYCLPHGKNPSRFGIRLGVGFSLKWQLTKNGICLRAQCFYTVGVFLISMFALTFGFKRRFTDLDLRIIVQKNSFNLSSSNSSIWLIRLFHWSRQNFYLWVHISSSNSSSPYSSICLLRLHFAHPRRALLR